MKRRTARVNIIEVLLETLMAILSPFQGRIHDYSSSKPRLPTLLTH